MTLSNCNCIHSLLITALLAATIFATLNDYWDSPFIKSLFGAKESESSDSSSSSSKSSNKILSCFSAKRNAQLLFGNAVDDVKCIHGLKAIALLILIVSFKLIPMGRVPYSNRNKLTEFFNSPLSTFLRSSILYTDVFLVISGFLATLGMLKSDAIGAKLAWPKRVIGRYLRLALPLLVVLLFYAFIWEHLGTGPQWSAVVTHNADLCKRSMWRNLFFIQNFYPVEEMVSEKSLPLQLLT